MRIQPSFVSSVLSFYKLLVNIIGLGTIHSVRVLWRKRLLWMATFERLRINACHFRDPRKIQNDLETVRGL